MSNDSLVMSIPSFASKVGISRGLCYRLARENKLPVKTLRLGRRMCVSRKAVEELLGAVKKD